MYCSKCGKELMEGAIFCSACGNQVGVISGANPASISPIKTKEEERRESIRFFQKALDYFKEYSDLYNEEDILVDKTMKRMAEYEKNKKPLVGCAAACFMLMLVTMFSKTFFGVAIMSGIFGVLSVLFLKLIKKHSEKLMPKIMVIEEELQTIYDESPYNGVIDSKYTHPNSLSMMVSLSKSGRCNTIDSVINTYEEDMHRREMLAIAEETNEHAKSASRKSGTAAALSGTAAVFSTLNFFLRR